MAFQSFWVLTEGLEFISFSIVKSISTTSTTRESVFLVTVMDMTSPVKSVHFLGQAELLKPSPGSVWSLVTFSPCLLKSTVHFLYVSFFVKGICLYLKGWRATRKIYLMLASLIDGHRSWWLSSSSIYHCRRWPFFRSLLSVTSRSLTVSTGANPLPRPQTSA